MVSYNETTTIPGIEPGVRSAVAKVLMGSDGQVSVFSKRFNDDEKAARVQFRRAECLFELAKEYRKDEIDSVINSRSIKARQLLAKCVHAVEGPHVFKGRAAISPKRSPCTLSLASQRAPRCRRYLCHRELRCHHT